MEILKKIIENNNYSYYGIRVDDNYKYNIGDVHKNSHTLFQDEPWENCDLPYEDGFWIGDELNGTCCLEVTKNNIDCVLSKSKIYFGDHMSLIAGNYAENGNDIGEIIIKNAIVLETWER